MSNQQTVLVVTALGQPVEATQQPILEPGAGQVQIKITVANFNPHDQKARDRGFFIKDRLPAPLGNDVVGRVTQLGPGVTSFAVGDRVASQGAGPAECGSQEYALGDVRFMAKIPDAISDDDAATLPVNLLTVVIGLFATLDIPAPWSAAASSFDAANASLLIVGGGSNCGRFAVQVARLAKIGTIVVVGGNEDELTGYGATHVIDRHGSYTDTLAKIRAVVGDDLLYALDVVTMGDGQLLALNALSSTKKGALARLKHREDPDMSKVIGKQAGVEIKNTLGLCLMHPELSAQFWPRLPEYLANGTIKASPRYQVKHGLTAKNLNDLLDWYRDDSRAVQTHLHVSS